MRRNRIILGTLALPALLAAPAPAALAGGPLLSGYGGPGAGAQTIVGATLLNGPQGGSGGGSVGNAGGTPGSSSSSSSPSSLPTSASGVAAGGRGGQAASKGSGARSGSPSPRRARGRGSSVGSTGASSPPRQGASAVASVGAGASWFTGGDLLALVLAAGVLALVTGATLRLSGTGAHHD